VVVVEHQRESPLQGIRSSLEGTETQRESLIQKWGSQRRQGHGAERGCDGPSRYQIQHTAVYRAVKTTLTNIGLEI